MCVVSRRQWSSTHPPAHQRFLSAVLPAAPRCIRQQDAPHTPEATVPTDARRAINATAAGRQMHTVMITNTDTMTFPNDRYMDAPPGDTVRPISVCNRRSHRLLFSPGFRQQNSRWFLVFCLKPGKTLQNCHYNNAVNVLSDDRYDPVTSERERRNEQRRQRP